MSQNWNFVYQHLRRLVRVVVVCCLSTTIWHKQCPAQTLHQPAKVDGTSGQTLTIISDSSRAPKQTQATTAKTGFPEPQLLQRIEELIAASRFHEAIPFAQELLGISEKSYGIGHSNTTIALNSLGEIYYEAHNFTNAASFHQRALEIREKWLV